MKNQASPVMMTNFIDRSKKPPRFVASICSFEVVHTSRVLNVLGEQLLTKLASSLRITIFVFMAAYLGCDSTSTKRQIKNDAGVVDHNEVGEAELREIARGSAKISFGKDFAPELERAMNAKQSIVFAHVKWAQMGFQRKFFCNFANTYRDSHPRDATSFFYVDFTQVAFDSAPLKELNGWSELRPAARVIHGNGELIWILNGKIVSVEPIMNYTLDELVKKTETTFARQLPLHPKPQSLSLRNKKHCHGQTCFLECARTFSATTVW